MKDRLGLFRRQFRRWQGPRADYSHEYPTPMMFNFMNSRIDPIPTIGRSRSPKSQSINPKLIPKRDNVPSPIPAADPADAVESDELEESEREGPSAECPSMEETESARVSSGDEEEDRIPMATSLTREFDSWTVSDLLPPGDNVTVLWHFARESITEIVESTVDLAIDRDLPFPPESITRLVAFLRMNIRRGIKSPARPMAEQYQSVPRRFAISDPISFATSEVFGFDAVCDESPIHPHLIDASEITSGLPPNWICIDRPPNDSVHVLEHYIARDPQSFPTTHLVGSIVNWLFHNNQWPICSNLIDDPVTSRLIADWVLDPAPECNIDSLENFTIPDSTYFVNMCPTIGDLLLENTLPLRINITDEHIIDEIVSGTLIVNAFIPHIDCPWHRPLATFLDRSPSSFVTESFCSALLDDFVDDFSLPLDSNSVDQFTLDRLVLKAFANLFDWEFPSPYPVLENWVSSSISFDDTVFDSLHQHLLTARVLPLIQNLPDADLTMAIVTSQHCSLFPFDQISLPPHVESVSHSDNTPLVIRSELFANLLLPVLANLPDDDVIALLSTGFVRFLDPHLADCDIRSLLQLELAPSWSTPIDPIDFDNVFAQGSGEPDALGEGLPCASAQPLTQNELRPVLAAPQTRSPRRPFDDVIVNIFLQCYEDDQPRLSDSGEVDEFQTKWMSQSTDTPQYELETEGDTGEEKQTSAELAFEDKEQRQREKDTERILREEFGIDGSDYWTDNRRSSELEEEEWEYEEGEKEEEEEEETWETEYASDD
jgi:hypothetical protein